MPKASYRPKRPPAARPRASHKITLCMIARDEAGFIEDAIKSVRGVADEIVLVDTGSADGTPELARALGANVYEFEWTGSFSEARNESLAHATGDWVLVLDADERLDASSKAAVLTAVREGRADAYLLSVLNYMTADDVPDVFVHQVCRLFRNRPEHRFTNRIHEQVEASITGRGGTVDSLDAIIHHLGYRTDILNERGKVERNIQLLERELQERPADVYMLYHLGLTYSSRDPEKAIGYLRKAASEVDPSHSFLAPMIYSRLSMACSAFGRLDEALACLQEAEERGIRHPELDYRRGKALLSAGRPEEAIPAFVRAIQSSPEAALSGDTSSYGYMAYLQIGAAYVNMGCHAEAVQWLEEGLKRKPGHLAAREHLARQYAQLGRLDKAEEEWLRLISARPEDPAPAHANLIRIYELQGRFREAAEQYEWLIESGVDSEDIRAAMEACRKQAGSQEKAEEFLLSAIRTDPSCVQAHHDLARLYSSQGRVSEALAAYARVIELDPDCTEAFFNAGDTLYNASLYAEAADIYSSGLAADPGNAPGFFMLGNSYFQLGAYEAALVSYRQALSIRPDYEEARSNLALAEEMLTSATRAA